MYCEEIFSKVKLMLDTLLDTAQILASAGYKKFIVLTGAFKPHTFKDSDAEFNLGVAIGALQMMKEFGGD